LFWAAVGGVSLCPPEDRCHALSQRRSTGGLRRPTPTPASGSGSTR